MEPKDDWAEDVNSDWDEGSVDGLAEDDWDEDMNSDWGEVSVDGLKEDSVNGFADHNICLPDCRQAVVTRPAITPMADLSTNEAVVITQSAADAAYMVQLADY